MDKDKFQEEYKPLSLRKNIAKQVDYLKTVDPLAMAEEITGERDSKDSSGLGLLIMRDKSKQMRELMDMTDDTKFANKLSDYIRKIENFGFVKVYEKGFFDKDIYSGKKTKEKHFMYFHYEYSILLNFDTYNKDSVNGSSFYYNWSPNNIKERSQYTSSGCMLKGQYDENYNLVEITSNIGPEPRWGKTPGCESWESFKEKDDMWNKMYWAWINQNNLRWIWRGDHDGREAVKHNIQNLADNGVFLKKWKDNPIISLCNHSDWDRMRNKIFEKQSNKLTVKRMKMLPQDVQDAIGEYQYK